MDYCNTATGCKGENNVLRNTCMFCPIYLHPYRTFLRCWSKHAFLNTQTLNALSFILMSISFTSVQQVHSHLITIQTIQFLSSLKSKRQMWFQEKAKTERELQSMDLYTESPILIPMFTRNSKNTCDKLQTPSETAGQEMPTAISDTCGAANSFFLPLVSTAGSTLKELSH